MQREDLSVNKDLTIGNSRSTLWLYCLPLLGSMLFQQLYNIADSIIAGQFISEEALAAVGNASEITLFYMAFAVGCSIGCNVITSQYFGSKNYKDLKSGVSTAFIAFGVLCIALMIFGFTAAGPILKLINTPEELYDDTMLYLNIYTIGMMFVFFYNVSTGVFTALGDSKTPFIFLAISSLGNIAVDILFVSVFNMGIAGVAWATVLCQGLSCILSMSVLFVRLRKFKCEEKIEKFSIHIFKKLCIVAIPSILQQTCISIGNIAVQGVINAYGKSVMAGYTASLKLNNIATSCFMANANGVSSYVAQNIGAKKFERLKEGFKNGQYLNWIIAIPLFIAFGFFGKYCVSLFINGEATDLAINTGVDMLKFVAPFYFLISVKITTDGFLRGAGAMKLFMITTFVDLIARVVFAYIFDHFFGLDGVWWSWGVGWVLGMIVGLYMYYKQMWRKYLNLIVD